MASKIFLDANVLLDFTLKRKAYPDAKKLIELILEEKIKGFVTPAIIHIVGYWLTKAYGAKKAKELLLSILVDIQSLDIPHEIVINALLSKINDIEDSLQYYTALHYKLDYFISEDKLLKKESTSILPVYTIKEFLEEFEY
ncbi:MAG TPA: PIN domain-containing protein [Hanamia sp.]|nr:PIN domain-containing protein [Hanamia sp.]